MSESRQGGRLRTVATNECIGHYRRTQPTPPAKSLSAQKKRYEEFIKVFNYDRPHEALGMKTPASVYSSRRKQTRRTEPKISYGKDYIVRGVRRNGTIRWKNERFS